MTAAREARFGHIDFVTGRSKGTIEDYVDHQIGVESVAESETHKYGIVGPAEGRDGRA